MNLEAIIEDCGLVITGSHSVSGGDINAAFCLYSGEEKYFLKVNSSRHYTGMFQSEAKGLNVLRVNTSIIVPGVIKYGLVNEQQYLLLSWLETGRPQPDCMEKFGGNLALMHRQTKSYFGLEVDNYIGSIPQQNTRHTSWGLFYEESRILPLVKRLVDSGSFSGKDMRLAEQFCKKLDNLFPAEPPALLHGDLWVGNYMVTSTGYVAIYDPAIYYGHREMDIGMSKLFGGFDQRFYKAYHEIYPLDPGWERRLSLTQLYPLLVHAVLFGGHYIERARGIIEEYS